MLMVDVGALALLVNKKNVHLEAEGNHFSCIVWHCWGGGLIAYRALYTLSGKAFLSIG